ncbi:MAG: Co2+/Mg2+ efflux protein ApaG [Burkholderiaceae bacterium]
MPTYRLHVTVKTRHIPEQSDPSEGRYVFAYAITITNAGDVPTQVISRHWIITDADAHIEEVKGLGVVGHQPLLAPGESFEYTSGTALATATGSMRGSYFAVAEDGTRFEAPIDEFSLAVPSALH